MTESILSFSLKSMVCSAVFVVYYLFVLKNAQTHRFNRIYLLTAALLSLLLPFARFEIVPANSIAIPDFPLLAINAKGTEEIVTKTPPQGIFNWSLVLTIIYFTVTTIMVLSLLLKFIQIFALKRKGQKIIKNGFVLIKTADSNAPFSFMNMLFWPKHMQEDSNEGQSILMHELAHIKQYHTLDKIFMLLILAVSWLNPFNWLIKKELWLQHEFLADKEAIKDRNTETFARMLLYGVSNSSNGFIINSFFQSPIKRRLQMLLHPTGNTYNILRRGLSIPVLLLAIVLLSANTTQSRSAIRAQHKIILVLDAAHGGKDVGGKSVYGPQEKDLTLTLCKKLIALSSEYNVEIISTRNEDVSMTLEERLHKSNSIDDAIFISLHLKKNIASIAQNNIYELGVNPKSANYDKSILLASSIANKLQMEKLPAQVVDQGNAYVIKKNSHPALLLECGNLDDDTNLALLKDEAHTEALCRNILSGIVDYNNKITSK